MNSRTSLLDVRDLSVSFQLPAGILRAVDKVSFTLERGRVLGIVGESGSGKSVTAQAIMGLRTGESGTTCTGDVRFNGRNLLELNDRELRRIRGNEVAMVFQDPMTSLNPVHRVGRQITEMIHLHTELTRKQARQRSIELLGEVGIPDPERRIDDYPHQFSGGMRQRAMIAMALACDPLLLIADEPTTALDVTIQAQILELLARLSKDSDLAIILITHDLGVVADIADDVAVMYAGRILEVGQKRSIFYDASHPYTWGLLAAIPRLDRPRPTRLRAIPGTPPSLLEASSECAFRPRCQYAFDRCEEEPPLDARVGDESHRDRCWLDVASKRNLRDSSAALEAHG